MKRGDVVMAVLPNLEGGGANRRPVVIVQADYFNESLRDTTVASVTSNMSLVGPPNRLHIDPASPKGASSGLNHRSVVRCDRLSTIPQWGVGRKLGQLSTVQLAEVEACLKAALDLK